MYGVVMICSPRKTLSIIDSHFPYPRILRPHSFLPFLKGYSTLSGGYPCSPCPPWFNYEYPAAGRGSHREIHSSSTSMQRQMVQIPGNRHRDPRFKNKRGRIYLPSTKNQDSGLKINLSPLS